MKHLLLAVAILAAPAVLAQTPTVFDDPDLVKEYQATITPEDMAGHLYVYASDYFEGRETGTRGQHLASLYLAGQHQTMGLTPMGTVEAQGPHDPRVFLQPFALERNVVRIASFTAAQGSRNIASTTYGADGMDGQSYLAFGSDGETSSTMVFGGHGVSTERYDDFVAMSNTDIDYAGKWLLLLDAEPMSPDGQSLISDDGEPTGYTRNAFQKIRTAFQGGMPAGIMLVGDSDPRGYDFTVTQRAAGRLNRMGGLSLPALPGAEEDGGRTLPPMVVVTSEYANALLASSGHTVASLREGIAESVAPTVFEIAGVTLSSVVTSAKETVMSDNVVAFIPGSDPILKSEVVVVSAHLDHIGMDPLQTPDGLSNGADDDGSGTVALLEIAEAFMQAKADGHGPRRSIVILHVSGEEKGLLGSEYFADREPLVPLAQVVANLNIDMIGRHDPTYEGSDRYIDIIGAELISTDIDAINTRVNEVTGLGLELSKRYNSPDDPNRFFQRSDHWNFGKHDIPFIFYFNGTHEDYHGVDDEPEKIDYDLMAERTRLIFGTAWQLANQDERPAVSGVGFN